MSGQRIFEVVYLRAAIDDVWQALTDPEQTSRYWFDTRVVSDWKVGSKIQYIRNGELTDEHVVLAVERPQRLVHTFQPLFGEFRLEPPSRVEFTIEQCGRVCRLTMRHDGFPPDSKVFRACCDGWPMILSNLKTWLETGEPLPPFTFPPQNMRFA